MIISGGTIAITSTPAPIRRNNKQPSMCCPTCGAKGNVRSSEEIDPMLRRLYFACTDFRCGHTWAASLQFEKTISPSGFGPQIRQANIREVKPPGADFGQMTIFDAIERSAATG